MSLTWIAALLAGTIAANATAQTLPSGPVAVADSRLILGGEFSATIAPDDAGWFNYTGYEASTLRQMRGSVLGTWRVSDRVAVLGELRAQTGAGIQAYGLYLRVRPWTRRQVDIQAGRIPPVFGAYGRRAYGAENPLIGVPLAYQYLTSLRADAVPASADDLLRMRGEGWRSRFPIGERRAATGLPLVDGLRWDTGVQVRAAAGSIDAAIAVTTGSLSRPRVGDDNDGRQLAGRVAWRPIVGLVVGASAARGAYLTQRLADSLPPGATRGRGVQRAAGADIEYSRDHWLWRAEGLVSTWALPVLEAPRVPRRVKAAALSTEGRYTLVPGLYAALRLEHLAFSRVAGSIERASWDAPVTRVEAGVGYRVQRNLLLKGAYQQNWRDAGAVRKVRLGAAQLVVWF